MKYRIEETGCFSEEDEPMWIHLIIEEDEIDDSELKVLKKIYKPDFISQQLEGSISFIHATQKENEESIAVNGLIPSGINGDLGVGIYVIEKGDVKGECNLTDYVASRYMEGEDDILAVMGKYTGVYTYCLEGFYHEGYIVIPERIPVENIDNIDEDYFENESIY